MRHDEAEDMGFGIHQQRREEQELERLVCSPKTTSPAAQRQWVGLETSEVVECWHNDPYKFYRAIEAKLREKNNL